MSWIDDEAKKAISSDDEKARRENAFTQQAGGMWHDLQQQIGHDVAQINQNQDLVTRRLGGNQLRIGTSGDGRFQVIKEVFPAVYLRLSYRGRFINMERETVANGHVRTPRKEQENLSLELDQNYKMFLKTEQGAGMTVVETSQYLLTPLLNT